MKTQQLQEVDIEDFLKLRNTRFKLGLTRQKQHEYNVDFEKDSSILFADILSKAKEEAESWGGHFIFVYLSSHPDWPKHRGRGKPHYNKVLDIVPSLGIPIINTQKLFQEDEMHNLYYIPDGESYAAQHYSPSGYSLVAREILDSGLLK